MMKAKTILDAILAMKAMDAIDYTTRPAVWATALTNLANARFELQYELGAVRVYVEPAKPQTCAEYYHVATADEIAAGKPDLTVAKP